MALVSCLECKKEVSTSAKSCPHCGTSKPRGGHHWALWLLAGLAAVGMVERIGRSAVTPARATASALASDTPTQVMEKHTAPVLPIIVEASDLWRDYHANEVAADDRYKGRTLLVDGTVTGIRKGVLNSIILDLKGPNEFMSVHAHLVKSEAAEAAALSKGRIVTLFCTGAGMVIGSPILRDCTFN